MKLEFHIFKETVRALAIGLVGVIAIVLPPILVSASLKLPGVGLASIGAFAPLVLAELLPHLLPIVFLLAVIWALARAKSDGEWTAAAMSGIHPLRMCAPALLIGVALSLATYGLFANGLPAVCRAQRLAQSRALRTAVTRTWAGRTDVDLHALHVTARERDGEDFVGAVVTLEGTGREPARMITADRVRFTFDGTEIGIELTNARSFEGAQMAQAGTMTLRIELADLTGEDATPRLTSLRYRTSSELRASLNDGSVDTAARRRIAYELRQREANAAAALVFLAIAIPIGLGVGGASLPLASGIAFACALAYYVLSMRLGRFLSQSGGIPPFAGAWLANFVVLAAGIPAAIRALRR